jgi:hypothetical protein
MGTSLTDAEYDVVVAIRHTTRCWETTYSIFCKQLPEAGRNTNRNQLERRFNCKKQRNETPKIEQEAEQGKERGGGLASTRKMKNKKLETTEGGTVTKTVPTSTATPASAPEAEQGEEQGAGLASPLKKRLLSISLSFLCLLLLPVPCFHMLPTKSYRFYVCIVSPCNGYD